MRVLFLRHGDAANPLPGTNDVDRELTVRGRTDIAHVATTLGGAGTAFDTIISSPYRRAIQTAGIIAEGTGFQGQPAQDERLVPFGLFAGTCDLIKEHSGAETLLLVGHQPSIGECISGMCAENRLELQVLTASCAAVDIYSFRPHARGRLLWFLSPELITSASA